MRLFYSFISCFFFLKAFSQDSIYLKVHFLYGSRPNKEYKATEERWFGGVLGGHVGMEADSGKILNFVTKGSFHVFPINNNRHSRYALHDEKGFYEILGGDAEAVKKTVVYVPITKDQRVIFDSLCAVYLQQTPYDYALFGMRCGAATYEVLGQLGILPLYSQERTSRAIFYPRKLRKRLLKKAESNNWIITRQQGTSKRIWETD